MHTKSYLFSFGEVWIIWVEYIVVMIPSDEVEAHFVMSPSGCESSEFYIEIVRILNSAEKEAVELSGLINEGEESFIFTFEVLVEVAGVEVDATFIERDVEPEVFWEIWIGRSEDCGAFFVFFEVELWFE